MKALLINNFVVSKYLGVRQFFFIDYFEVEKQEHFIDDCGTIYISKQISFPY